MKISVLSKLFIISLTMNLIQVQNVHAYIDLGTGSYILQFLIAGIVGMLYIVKIYWKKIKFYLTKF